MAVAQGGGTIGQSYGAPVQAVNRPHDKEKSMRYRSFVERYVVARAENFRVGHEKEDAWAAIQDAENIYNNIARRGRRNNEDEPDGT